MRILATILNVLLILFVGYLLFDKPRLKGEDLLILILFLSTPIINLIAFHFENRENWIFLYFKRKSLEEKKKIQELTNTKDGGAK